MLCVAMMLSVMVMSTGAVTITDADDISPQYAEAAEVLTGMGIINGYEDDSFKPQQSITRAEVAAMIYRVATGDVEDEKADINAGAKLFPDVDKDDWYAGYVNYCGDAAYIKGYEDDTFRADNNVTGFEVLAMILRALGYDSNKEFTGPTWTINVVSTATDVGMLKNLDNSVDLAVPASREVVAELIFQAIRPVNENVNANTEMVHWSLAAGDYRPDNAWNPESLGEKVFNLDVENDADMWGRPNIEWFNDKTDDVYAAIEIAPVETYKTAVAECDVYEDTGVSGQVNGYLNGQETTYNISKTATKNTIGAQGQLVEVYDYTTVDGDDATRIVAIDTFLAQVTDVTEAKFDPNNHLAVDATLTLAVYDAEHSDFTTVELENGADNWTYAEGDMLLVNAYADANGKVFHTGEAEQVGDEAQYVEILGAAESFVGAQTKIHANANSHTVNGTDYPDAFKFFCDEVGTTEDYNFNWYLDQYGNLIGVTAITGNYAVLKDMIWINGGRDGGHAEATLVYMNGTEATVTVDSIDEFDANDWASLRNGTDTTPSLSDGRTDFGLVSTDSSLNGDYEGYAMYRVDTNSDGSVNLEGTEVYPPDAASLHIEYADDVTLNINASAIVDVDSLDVITHVSNSTQFLLKNGDTYTAYTGTANLPDFNWETVEVFYDDEDGDNVADYVYIKSYSDVHGMYVFATSASSYIDVPSRNVVTLEDVYVDGELTEVTTTRDLADKLIRNLGKLYYATWQDDHEAGNYGQLIDVTLVRENTDNDVQVLFGGIANYLNPDMDDNFNYVNGTLVVSEDLSYNVGSTVEVIYTNETYTMNLADVVKAMKDGTANYGLWVVGDRFNNTYTVYAGTELSNDTSISVTATETAEGTNIYDIDLNKGTSTYEVTLKDRNTEGALTVKANNEYAQYQIGSEIFTGDEQPFIKDYYFGDSFQVIVSPEDGTASKTWTVTVNDYHQIDGVITKVMSSGESSSVGGVTNPLPMYKNFADAVTYAPTLDVDTIQFIALFADNNLVVADQANGDNWTQYAAKSHFFTTTSALNQTTFDANAKMLDFDDNGKSVQIGDVQGWGANSTYVVSMVVRDEDSAFDEVVYFAFHVDK